MKLNINDFSKQGLVDIVWAAEEKGIFPEKLLARLLRLDLGRRVHAIIKELESLGPKIKAQGAKLTIRSSKKKTRAYNRMMDKYNRLKKSGDDKVEKIRAIEAEWPELKPGDSASQQTQRGLAADAKSCAPGFVEAGGGPGQAV